MTIPSDWLLSIFQATSELAATYAALILADDGIEITVRALSTKEMPF